MSSDGATPPRPTRHSLVDSAIYVDGDRTSSPHGLVETYRQLHERLAAMAWIGLYRPDQQELLSRAHDCGLHELAVENTILAHQRPKLERCDAILFVVLRSGQPGYPFALAMMFAVSLGLFLTFKRRGWL